MPLIQLKLGPEIAKKCLVEEMLQNVAFHVAEAMEWPVERLTVVGEVVQDKHWFNSGGRLPLAQIYWLEGKGIEDRQKVMLSVASEVATALGIEMKEVNVMVIELKQGSLLTEGRFL